MRAGVISKISIFKQSILWGLSPFNVWIGCSVVQQLIYRNLHLKLEYIFKPITEYADNIDMIELILDFEQSIIWARLKGTQDWEIFWLRFWNLFFFVDS